MIRLTLFLLALAGFPVVAAAAEADLPIVVRILDCTTYEKAKDVCDNENKCCAVAERKRLEKEE